MKTGIDKSTVMRNAWYLKRVVMRACRFGECLRRAWRNEKMRRMQRLAEGLPAEDRKPAARRDGRNSRNNHVFVAGCIAFYANARPGTYFGD